MTQTAVDADREIVMERVFDAPRALVYQAFTDTKHLPNWFGPKGFTITSHSRDFRVGGSWHYVMHGPNDMNFDNYTRYVEIVPNERLVYDMGDSKDNPPHFRATITLTDEGGRTRVHQHMVFPTAEACAAVKGFGAVELGYQTLDKLAAHLKTMGLRITRTFDAPRELVYKAWSEADRLLQWWGPKGMTLDVKHLDFKPNGTLHYKIFNEQAEMWGLFKYVDMTPPERIIFVNSFSDPDGNIVRAPFAADFPLQIYNVIVLTEEDGKTTLDMSGTPLNASEAELAFFEGMSASMQGGFKGTFDQLEAYLAAARG